MKVEGLDASCTDTGASRGFISPAPECKPETFGPNLSELIAPDAASFKLNILLVDDDRAIRMLYKVLLEKYGHTVTTACNGREGLEMIQRSPPHLVISDWVMPEMNGLELCRALRKNPDWQHIYVFIVTSQESTEKLIEAFEAGINDYLTKPINPRVLAARLHAAQRIIQMQALQEAARLQLQHLTEELARSNERLKKLALTDVLTGLPNRRYGMARLEQEWAIAARSNRPVCCMMVDIDHFKKVNDTYGHKAGDDALKLVARILQQTVRKQDMVCRLGGEEFMVICPDSDQTLGHTYAERLRQHVAAQSSKFLLLTISIGVTDQTQLDNHEAMLQQADKRLYVAKARGRNCTVSA